ncbi:WD-repeat-containing protein [Coprinopsis cinerea okayama7|uniref:WD-repeat-containing protein n=1 Tax=Coprinopsis cinerea (strain Okayama-7 / 130 / ATCC MYA-4618 / FGSC 9003) TaxID=240176 RepID=A8NNC0_COPC7|nr:WD-repeat-containing protein [Coprinopsis cinerea okayama7\|eukprot:XP_001835095.2 WD-repeat-containing protein [Coprinopsis cinerea okayama7\
MVAGPNTGNMEPESAKMASNNLLGDCSPSSGTEGTLGSTVAPQTVPASTVDTGAQTTAAPAGTLDHDLTGTPDDKKLDVQTPEVADQDNIGRPSGSASDNAQGSEGVLPSDDATQNPAEKGSSGWKGTAYNGVKAVLAMIRDNVEFAPVKLAAGGLLTVLETIDLVKENREEVQKLLARLEILKEILESCPADLKGKLTDRLDGLSRTLEEKAKELEEKAKDSRLKRVANATEDAKDIVQALEEIRFAIEIAMATLHMAKEVTWLSRTVTETRDLAGAVKDDTTWLKKNGMDDGLPVLRFYSSSTFTELLKKIANVDGAEFNRGDRRGCIAGTRVALLSRLLGWAKDKHSPHVFWLSGMAGTGKTAVSETFCTHLFREGLLGGSFFCSLDWDDRQDVYRLLPALAKTLARVRPKFGEELIKVLESDDCPDNLSRMSLKDQYRMLILEPAEKSLSPDEVTVLSIDALDECTDKEALAKLLDIIISQKPPVGLKFFLTSRPEVPVREQFEDKSDGHHHQSLRLHDIELDMVRADINIFLHHEFASMPFLRKHFEGRWPPPELEVIVDMSGKLFIFAATFVKYIANYKGDRTKRFKQLAASTKGIPSLYHLYSRILTEAFEGLDDEDEVEDATTIRHCLSLLMVAQRPASVNDYAGLLGKGVDSIREAFKHLHSVINIPAVDDQPVSILHASFADYLTTESVRLSHPWAVERPIAHFVAADWCLRVMDEMLHFGVSGATTSYRSNDEQPVALSLPSHLAYACMSWAGHVVGSGGVKDIQLQKMLKRLLDILKAKAFYWMEALSVIKAVKQGAEVLSLLTQSSMCTLELKEVLHSAQRFVQTFHIPITQSASHIYLSALPAYRDILPLLPFLDSHHITATATFVHPGMGPQLLCLLGHTLTVTSVAFSPDGTTIASGSYDCSVRLWSTQSGEPVLGPLKGHTGPISVAFSPDGTTIASGSADCSVQLWSTQSGEPVLGPLEGHTGVVTSVAFYPDGTTIASGSSDGSVWLWSTQSGEPVLGPLGEHTDLVSSVAFSPDGTTIASGSWDGLVRLWSTQSGQPVLGPLEGHTGAVTSVAFSPDGTTIASGSYDCSVWLWSTQSGQPVLGPLEGHTGSVNSVAFSPDGTTIASGSADCSVWLWGTQSGEPVLGPLEGHTDTVTSVVFSPDGTTIASGSADCSVRLWSTQSGEPVLGPLEGHTGSVTLVAFSPDGTTIASGSYDCSVRLWSTQSGEPVLGPLEGHTGAVTSVAFSPDGTTFASGSGDCSVRLWSTQSGQPVLGPLGHTWALSAAVEHPEG